MPNTALALVREASRLQSKAGGGGDGGGGVGGGGVGGGLSTPMQIARFVWVHGRDRQPPRFPAGARLAASDWMSTHVVRPFRFGWVSAHCA